MSAVEEKSNKGEYEGFFTNRNGKKLYCRYWSEESGLTDPRALLFIAHGVAEHCLSYTELAQELTAKGLYVFSHDHIGHGQSEGPRVHIDRFSQYTQDIFDHINKMKEKFPNIPVFIIGHSMGGMITVKAVMEQPTFFKGMVLIGPALVPDPKLAGPVKVFLGQMVASVYPQCPVLKLDISNISRDPDVVQTYQDDPLVYHGSLKARWGKEVLATVQYLSTNFDKVDIPFLTLHGTMDKMASPESSKQLHERASSKDKTMKLYEGFYHQLHKEVKDDAAKVRKDIIDWLMERI